MIFVKYAVLLGILFIASLTDIKEYKIPNPLIGIGLISALIFMPSLADVGWFALAVGGLFLFGMLGIFGAGDVKLWMVIAGFLGFMPSLYIFITTQFLLFFYVLITAPHKFGLSLTSPIEAWRWFKRRKINNNYYPLAPFLFAATAGWIVLEGLGVIGT